MAQNAGVASVLRVDAADEAQQAQFKRCFDRSARYDELTKNIESLRVGFGVSDASAIARVLHKQRRDFEAIAALDFFPNEARARTEQALAQAQAEVRGLLFPAQASDGFAKPAGPVAELLLY